jgi:hypothetical protein
VPGSPVGGFICQLYGLWMANRQKSIVPNKERKTHDAICSTASIGNSTSMSMRRVQGTQRSHWTKADDALR